MFLVKMCIVINGKDLKQYYKCNEFEISVTVSNKNEVHYVPLSTPTSVRFMIPKGIIVLLNKKVINFL